MYSTLGKQTSKYRTNTNQITKKVTFFIGNFYVRKFNTKKSEVNNLHTHRKTSLVFTFQAEETASQDGYFFRFFNKIYTVLSASVLMVFRTFELPIIVCIILPNSSVNQLILENLY
jgi:hypothetical protein